MQQHKRIWRILFWLYITVLFLVVIIKFRGSFDELINKAISVNGDRDMGFWNLNLIPFQTIGPQLRHINQSWALFNIVGNIVAFIPFGFLFPLAYPKNKGVIRIFIIAFLSVLSIETFQLITMLGTFDIDDIILNVSSILLGYGILVLLQRFLFKDNQQKNY